VDKGGINHIGEIGWEVAALHSKRFDMVKKSVAGGISHAIQQARNGADTAGW